MRIFGIFILGICYLVHPAMAGELVAAKQDGDWSTLILTDANGRTYNVHCYDSANNQVEIIPRSERYMSLHKISYTSVTIINGEYKLTGCTYIESFCALNERVAGTEGATYYSCALCRPKSVSLPYSELLARRQEYGNSIYYLAYTNGAHNNITCDYCEGGTYFDGTFLCSNNCPNNAPAGYTVASWGITSGGIETCFAYDGRPPLPDLGGGGSSSMTDETGTYVIETVKDPIYGVVICPYQ